MSISLHIKKEEVINCLSTQSDELIILQFTEANVCKKNKNKQL